MRVVSSVLLALLIGSTALQGCGEPLTEHEREMRRIGKEIKRLKRQHPEAFLTDGSVEKRQIDGSIERGSFAAAIAPYEKLLSMDVDIGTYPEEIEARALERLNGISEYAPLSRLEAYAFLSTVNPDEESYQSAADEIATGIRARADQARKQLTSRHDKVENRTWYYPKTTSTDPGAFFYMGTKEGQGPWLRLKVEWDSPYGWLFIDEVTAWDDGTKRTLVSGEFERRNTSHVWEWVDVSPTPQQRVIMESLAESDEALLRFHGRDRIEDHTIKAAQKRGILAILNAFDALEEEARLVALEERSKD